MSRNIIPPLKYRYGIFRRSAYDPIFHPYYIIYGRDKIEFFERMKSKSNL